MRRNCLYLIALGALAGCFMACSADSDSDTVKEPKVRPAGNPGAGNTTGNNANGGGTTTTPGYAQPGGSQTTTPGGSQTTTPGGGSTMPTTTGDPSCTPVDEPLAIDSTGWVAGDTNKSGIQGAWYWYADGVGTTVTGATKDAPPFVAGKGMCLSGATIVDTTYAAWGAGIGLDLNATGGATAAKAPFNATAKGITGFRINVSGDLGGLPLRVNINNPALYGDNAPFVELSASGSYCVKISEAKQGSWVAGAKTADPSAVVALQFQIVGGKTAAPFSFCIDSIEPF